MTQSAKCALLPNMEKTIHPEDKFLGKYLPEVQEFLLPIKGAKGLGKLAKKYGFDQARFSEFIAGKRRPTKYYVEKFIFWGDIPVQKFLQGKKLQNLSPDEQIFWKNAKVTEHKRLMKELRDTTDEEKEATIMFLRALRKKT